MNLSGPIEMAEDPCERCYGAGCLICARTAGEHPGACDPCPACSPVDPNDLANLLEREPFDRTITVGVQLVAFWDAVNAYARTCGGDTSDATLGSARMEAGAVVERIVTADGWGPTVSACERRAEDAERRATVASAGLAAAGDRIKMLEEVLVAVRVALSAGIGPGTALMACKAAISLISETLDPHKPWCADENHQGPCTPKDAGYEGGDDE